VGEASGEYVQFTVHEEIIVTVKAFIINYNRLDLPRRMADYIADCQNGVEPVFLDNNSDYPPLLEYYETTPHKVVRLSRNWGNCVVWYCGILDEWDLHGDFIVTDPDLEIDHIPKDWLDLFREGMAKFPDRWKVGFGLMRDDLPDTPTGRAAYGWEGMEWSQPVEGGRFYKASIDTTFCLCRTRKHSFDSVRTGPPYVARHVPWYYTCLDDIPEDELYYLRSITPGKWNYWSGKLREEMGL